MPNANVVLATVFTVSFLFTAACSSAPTEVTESGGSQITAGDPVVGAPDLRLMCAVGPDVGEHSPGVEILPGGWVNDPLSTPCCFDNGKKIACPDPVPPGSWCTDTRRDRENCGGCGLACAVGDICKDGACTKLCDDGLVACGTSHGSRDPQYKERNHPYCADVETDSQNCGFCGVACSDGYVCIAGGCKKAPAAANCNHNGRCERFTGEDAASCPDDCACSPGVACETIKAGTEGMAAEYCRLMTRGGGGGSYEWYTISDVFPYCDNEQTDRCQQIAKCGGRTFTCGSVPNGWTETPVGCN